MTTIQITGQRAEISASIIAGQPRTSTIVDVISIEGDALTYTQDGIWRQQATRSAYTDWTLIDPTAEFEAPEADPAESDPAEANPFHVDARVLVPSLADCPGTIVAEVQRIQRDGTIESLYGVSFDYMRTPGSAQWFGAARELVLA